MCGFRCYNHTQRSIHTANAESAKNVASRRNNFFFRSNSRSSTYTVRSLSKDSTERLQSEGLTPISILDSRRSIGMEDDIRRRSACDRCHSQKLRCPKRQGADVCERCAKAGTRCCYSPFRQKKDTERSRNSGIPPVDSIDPIRNKNTDESDESKNILTISNAHKRKRIAHISPEAGGYPFL